MNPDDGPDSDMDQRADDTHSVRLDADDPIAMSVVYAVARALGRQPLDLEPLSTQVDPEALETLLNGPIGRRDGLSVSFAFAECTVVVTPSRIDVSTVGPASD